MQTINKSMVGIVKSLDAALKANNLDKVATTMDQARSFFFSFFLSSLPFFPPGPQPGQGGDNDGPGALRCLTFPLST